MMNDRFSAQLRQHLLETANERAADGHLATIVAAVATTPQRPPLIARLPGLRARFDAFPAAIRFGFIALALALAAIAGAIIVGAGTPSRSTPFEGTWTATDVPDGSTMHLYVGAGSAPTVRFEDLLATGDACRNDDVKVFIADGVGDISGARLDVRYPRGGGCGLETVAIAGSYTYNPDADRLTDEDGIIWTRVAGPAATVPSLAPGASRSALPSPSTVFEGRWTATDPGDASKLTLIVGAGMTPLVQFQDDHATGAVCTADPTKVFRADGVGVITGGRLVASYPDGGGCGPVLVPIAGRYDYEPGTDMMRDQDGATWARVEPGVDPAATLRPAPTRTPSATLSGG